MLNIPIHRPKSCCFFLFQSITKRTKNDYVVAAAADGASDAGYTGPKLWRRILQWTVSVHGGGSRALWHKAAEGQHDQIIERVESCGSGVWSLYQLSDQW